jgi:hypothetical protein
VIDVENDQKFVLLSGIELFTAVLMFTAAVLSDDLASVYRLYEIFPIFLAGSIVTFGLREMKRRT